MNNKLFLCILTGLILSACASKPSEITYYQLNDTSISSAQTSRMDNTGKTYVQVASIKVPDYLKQSKLVLRTAPFKMHFAASHLWVQTPEKEIRAALVSDLNTNDANHYFVNFDPTLNGSIGNKLAIEISHFYPTENSEVVLHGYWTLVSDNNRSDSNRSDHKFQLNVPLEFDGYAHAVAQQRHLISLLAREITTQIHGK